MRHQGEERRLLSQKTGLQRDGTFRGHVRIERLVQEEQRGVRRQQGDEEERHLGVQLGGFERQNLAGNVHVAQPRVAVEHVRREHCLPPGRKSLQIECSWLEHAESVAQVAFRFRDTRKRIEDRDRLLVEQERRDGGATRRWCRRGRFRERFVGEWEARGYQER